MNGMNSSWWDGEVVSDGVERARLVVVLTTIGISISGMILFSLVPWSDWRTAIALNAVENAILIAFCIRRRDRLIPHLMLFGLAVGVVELLADGRSKGESRVEDRPSRISGAFPLGYSNAYLIR